MDKGCAISVKCRGDFRRHWHQMRHVRAWIATVDCRRSVAECRKSTLLKMKKRAPKGAFGDFRPVAQAYRAISTEHFA
ncbi:hypothetical protein TRM7557_03653 [Tritonibacter multivorans]|uniref:Uncharacterized protein n=1 Tax=Tritonibacter multivorans TaxID=928856 RepID=A0A0P1GIY4_9RHOB|nr:hypothetical protein TRM7557_03653 [Tritonibacter multivorans]SFC45622.1 hypothetical protein SAMN04488049_102490 [Tritonibacter multivorans]